MPPAAVDASAGAPDGPGTLSTLAKRLIAGFILAATMVAATLVLPTLWFGVLTGAFVLVGAWEWSRIAGWAAPGARAASVLAMAGILVLTGWLVGREAGTLAVMLAALAWWLVALAWVVRAQQGLPIDAFGHPAVHVATGWLVLAPAWGAMVALHGSPGAGPWLVVYLMGLVSTADSAAYFAGRRFGRRRLASNVSPGKSVEGVVGALVAVTMLAAVVAAAAGIPAAPGFVALGIATALVSVLGDLTESMFKRRAGIKDSGSIIPGHGGILDRIDGYTAAAPVFALGWFVLGSAL